MPVTFYVDPAILDDELANDVKTITLSYTFYRTLDDVPDEAPEIVSDADAGIGPKLTLTTAHLGGS